MKVEEKEFKRLELKASLLKSVAHPIRLAILKMFSKDTEEMLTVKNIYEKLGIGQPIASHHLGIMKRSGVLERIQKNGSTYYRISNSYNSNHYLIKIFND